MLDWQRRWQRMDELWLLDHLDGYCPPTLRSQPLLPHHTYAFTEGWRIDRMVQTHKVHASSSFMELLGSFRSTLVFIVRVPCLHDHLSLRQPCSLSKDIQWRLKNQHRWSHLPLDLWRDDWQIFPPLHRVSNRVPSLFTSRLHVVWEARHRWSRCLQK